MFKILKTDLLFILYQVTNKKPLNSENKLKKLQQLNYYLFFKLKNNAKNRSLNLRLADSFFNHLHNRFQKITLP